MSVSVSVCVCVCVRVSVSVSAAQPVNPAGWATFQSSHGCPTFAAFLLLPLRWDTYNYSFLTTGF